MYLTFPFTGIRRKIGFLREIEHSSNLGKPGLSCSTFKPPHRAYEAERCLFPDLTGVSPAGWRDLLIEGPRTQSSFSGQYSG